MEKQISIGFERDDLAALDAACERLRCSRSVFVRQAVISRLRSEERAAKIDGVEVGQALAAASRRGGRRNRTG